MKKLLADISKTVIYSLAAYGLAVMASFGWHAIAPKPQTIRIEFSNAPVGTVTIIDWNLPIQVRDLLERLGR